MLCVCVGGGGGIIIIVHVPLYWSCLPVQATDYGLTVTYYYELSPKPHFARGFSVQWIHSFICCNTFEKLTLF